MVRIQALLRDLALRIVQRTLELLALCVGLLQLCLELKRVQLRLHPLSFALLQPVAQRLDLVLVAAFRLSSDER